MVKPTRVTNSIRQLRFGAGEMTQADLADRIGVTRQTDIAIEQGDAEGGRPAYCRFRVREERSQSAQVFGVPDPT